MTACPYTIAASARRRGVPEATIARWFGLRDGQAAYTITRQDALRRPVVSVPAKGPPAASAPATRASGAPGALVTPSAVMVTCKAEGAPPAPSVEVRELTVGKILAAVAVAFETSAPAICGPARDKFTSRARFAASYIIRQRLGLSLTEIGRRLGNKDHTTVMNALKRATALMGDPAWRARYDAAEAALARKVGG